VCRFCLDQAGDLRDGKSSERSRIRGQVRGIRGQNKGSALVLATLRPASSGDTRDGSDNRACPSPDVRRSTPPSSSSPPASAPPKPLGTPNASPSPSIPAQDRTAKRQRDRAGASIGSDQTLPSRAARKLTLLRASLRAQDRSRGALPNSAPKKRFPSGPAGHSLKISKSVPFCVNRWDRPCGQPIGVSSVRTLP